MEPFLWQAAASDDEIRPSKYVMTDHRAEIVGEMLVLGSLRGGQYRYTPEPQPRPERPSIPPGDHLVRVVRFVSQPQQFHAPPDQACRAVPVVVSGPRQTRVPPELCRR